MACNGLSFHPASLVGNIDWRLEKEAETYINLFSKQGLHADVTGSYSTGKQPATIDFKSDIYG